MRIEHDPALTIERIEPRGFVMNRRNDGGYRLKGIMGGEPVVLLVPDAKALHSFWLGWLGRLPP